MNITVNGSAFTVTGPEISYEDVIALAGMPDGSKVTWRSGTDHPHCTGVLQAGVPMDVVEGMAFTVTNKCTP